MKIDPKKLAVWTDRIAFLLVVVMGALICFSFSDFQLHIAQGDHGNNLYAFRRTFQGALPYRDYWWVYGPIMPYYYSVFFAIFGVSMHSVLLGYTLLSFLSGIFFFWTVRLFFSNIMAVPAAVFLWIYNSPFEHTYNHAGGVLAIQVALFMFFSYMKKGRRCYLFWALGAIFILAMVKLNMGLAMLAGFVVALLYVDREQGRSWFEQRMVYLWAVAVIPVLIFASYLFFLWGLPFYAVRQCLLSVDNDPNHAPLSAILKTFGTYYLTRMTRYGIPQIQSALLVIFGYLAAMVFHRRLDPETRRDLKRLAVVLLVFAVFLWHEFFLSGVTYRLYWVDPLEIMLVFALMAVAVKDLPKVFGVLLCLLVLSTALGSHILRYRYFGAVRELFPIERAQIYTVNNSRWLITVAAVTNFLNENLAKDETFLAIPSEEIYYFFTDRDSPNRQQEFGVNITPEQEDEIIGDLEKKKVKYVVLSNHYQNPETGFGQWGLTYCQKLAQYVQEHYSVIAVVGDWDKQATWDTNHGVVIAEKIVK